MFFYKQVFHFTVTEWNTYALPNIVLLGVLAGLNSLYFTKSVLFFKKFFASFHNDYIRIIGGSLLISVLIFFVPNLYGEGYEGIKHVFSQVNVPSMTLMLPLVAVLLLKPIATSVTLGAGGDGGVFPVNFVLIGMARRY